MKKIIKYSIEFFSDWHCGSGLAAGADVDALVIKDKSNLPYIPGKTIKGLLREAVEDVLFFKSGDISCLPILFGNSKDKDNIGNEDSRTSACFFTNAELPLDIQHKIKEDKLSSYLYRSIASTSIENGVAKKGSLRKMQVVVPCILEGEIHDVPSEYITIVEEGLCYIKRLGQNRNRGLGRCQCRVIQKL